MALTFTANALRSASGRGAAHRHGLHFGPVVSAFILVALVGAGLVLLRLTWGAAAASPRYCLALPDASGRFVPDVDTLTCGYQDSLAVEAAASATYGALEKPAGTVDYVATLYSKTAYQGTVVTFASSDGAPCSATFSYNFSFPPQLAGQVSSFTTSPASGCPHTQLFHGNLGGASASYFHDTNVADLGAFDNQATSGRWTAA
jgi:hypothetical protein